MMNKAVFSAPFSHALSSVPRTMGLVMLALLPATLFSLYQFGWPAIMVFVLTVGSAILFEALSLAIGSRPVMPFLLDGSAALTGWLLALSLPPWSPWWVAVLGGFIAIVIGKQIYGGLGQNIFNPAMVARAVLLVSFPLEMTFFLGPHPLFAAGSPSLGDAIHIVFGGGIDFDAMSSASTLTRLKVLMHDAKPLSAAPDLAFDLRQTMAAMPGSLGEMSAVLLLLGGIFLIAMRIISWHTPAAMFAGMAVMAGLFNHFDPAHHPGIMFHLFSGGFMLGAFFIATDYVTQPITDEGRLIFGAGVGILTYFIRAFSVFPEGVAFAILLMNAMTPLIDHYVKPRIFGRDRQGSPLPRSDSEGELQ